MKTSKKLLHTLQNIGLAALVCAVALFCGLAIWNLTDDYDSRLLDREITLAERYELMSNAQQQSRESQDGFFQEEITAIASTQATPGSIVHDRK